MSELRAALADLVEERHLTPHRLGAAMAEIMDGKASPAAAAGLLIGLRMKGETVDEIVAVAEVLRLRATRVTPKDPKTIDTCGTGGSGLDTFNISTTSAFVVAGAGVCVAKHGNRAASSRAGSFDVFEALGVRIDLPLEVYGEILDQIGIAPFFAGARYQVVGVYSQALVEPLAGALVRLGAKRALVVHGDDGLDELTTTGPSVAALVDAGQVRTLRIEPETLGLTRCSAADLAGGDATANAAITRRVLAGEKGPQRDIVLLNAAAALWVVEAVTGLEEGLERAASSIDEGAATLKLEALRAATERAGEALSR